MKQFSWKLCLLTLGMLLGEKAAADTHEYVDLGLPSRTLWATMNVGATSETEAGSYFAWGESATKETYTQVNYTWASGITAEGEWGYQKLTKYYDTDDLKTLESADDAATTVWGSTWATPTPQQYQELLDNCTWIVEGNGYRVTASNGNSIYLPFAGEMYEGNVLSSDHGYYITNTRCETGDGVYPSDCEILSLTSSQKAVSSMSRFYGFSVRPVRTELAPITSVINGVLRVDNADLDNVIQELGSKNADVTELYITGNYTTTAALKSLKSNYFSNLEKIHLTLAGVTTIASSAYLGSTLLAEIIIPESVTSIGYSAFSGCTNLESMTLPFVGASANMTTASESTLFGYIFGSGSATGGTSTKQSFANSSSSTYWIPNSLHKVNITGGNILYGAFYGCSNLTSVSLSSGVTGIGDYAFKDCSNLVDVTIPSSVTSIGSSVFYCCSNLTKCDIPNSVTSIGNYAFYSCGKLSEVTIPNSVTSIGNYAFSWCLSLSEVTIPESVTSISNGAFFTCSSLQRMTFLGCVTNLESFYWNSNGLNTINELIFKSNTPATLKSADALQSYHPIYVPADAVNDYKSAEYWIDHASQIIAIGAQTSYDVSITASENKSSLLDAIGEDNVSNVISLTVHGSINSYDLMIIRNKMSNLESIDLSDVTVVANSYEYYTGYCSHNNTLDRYVFNSKIKSLKLPNNLEVLGSYVLENCSYLDELILPETLKTIGSWAFMKCSGIKELIVPNSVTSIGYGAFNQCYGLTSITLPFVGSTPSPTVASKETLFVYVFGSGGNTTYGESVYQYSTYYNLPKSLHNVTITGGKILSQAFLAYSIKSLTLPNIERIEDNSIKISSLEEITIPSSIKWIGESAFSYCTGLKRVNFESLESMLQIQYSNYYSNPLSNGHVLYINGEEITEITEIPESISKINDFAFYGCTSLTNITSTNNVKSIGVSAFQNCTSLQTVNTSASLENIGESAFNSCSVLKSLIFPTNSKISEIQKKAFYACVALQNISFPTSLNVIGDYTFYNCTNLKEIRIPSSIRTIGNYAFSGCSSLNDVYTYVAEPQSIDQNTFSTYTTATLHCPKISYYNYYYDTQWSQFLKLEAFDEPYEYIYFTKDFEIDNTTGVISGKPETDIESEGGLIVKDNLEQDLGEVNIKFDGTNNNAASLIGKVKANKINLELTVKANYWYTFCFPFDVKIANIQKSGGYVFRKYNGQTRANGNSGWEAIATGTEKLNAGEGYIFRTNTAGTLTITIDKETIDKFDLTANKETTLASYAAESGTTTDDNKSWNFVGNPYISYYDMNDLGYTAPVVVWNGTGYDAVRPGDDDLVFHPFQAFFVQKPENVDNVGFEAADQTTYQKSTSNASASVKAEAKARKARALNSSRKLVNLTLTDGNTTDKTRVVFNDEQKMDYEAECDAAKFPAEGVAQLFSLDSKGIKYAINERPMEDGTVQLGFTAPAEGEYSIGATRMDIQVYLKDNTTGEMFDLSSGEYTFKAQKGTDNSRFTLMVDSSATGVQNIMSENKTNDAIYDLSGRRLTNMQKGVNIVNGKKLMVK